MDEQNEQLLRQFFSEAAQQQIADDGFANRVMSQLPAEPRGLKRFSRWWTAFCVLLALVLFTLSHGWELLMVQLEVFVRTTIADPPQVNLLMVAFTLFSLLMVGLYELLTAERLIR